MTFASEIFIIIFTVNVVVPIAHFFHVPVKYRGKSAILSSHSFHLLPVITSLFCYSTVFYYATPRQRHEAYEIFA